MARVKGLTIREAFFDKKVEKKLYSLVVSGGGLGYLPVMPGTFGTLLGAAVAWWLASLGLSAMAYAIFVFLIIIASIDMVWEYQRHIKDKSDRKEIVIDEIVGYLVAVAFLPLTFKTYFAAFILFRILDITKPLFIGYIDKNVKGALGGVLDDLAAGVVANIIVLLLLSKTTLLA